MGKYRVEFDNKEIRSIRAASNVTPPSETMHQERTGEVMYAIIDAANDEEAREKAERLQVELKTGKTKRDLTGGQTPGGGGNPNL